MDRTEAAVQKTLAAVDAPLYDIGILTDQGMFPRMDALTAAQCIARVRYLKHRNAAGAHIYFRPSGERRFTLLDDLSRTLLADLSARGFEPCAVVETSPENFQAWLRHSRLLSKDLGTVAAQLLAQRFSADPSAADWRRFGRLPASPTASHSTCRAQDSFHLSGCSVTPASSSPQQIPSSWKQNAPFNRREQNASSSGGTFGHGSADRLPSPSRASAPQ